jgi:SpoVK/Ycf46/Vps4 family AAA+-type ATPase
MAHLERIDLLVHAQVQRARASYQADSAFHGLYISEQEVDALLARPTGRPHWAAGGAWHDPSVLEAFDRLGEAIGVGEQRAPDDAKRLRLTELTRFFGLTPFDRDTLLICLAPELDLRYERLYAYLQDDVTKKQPSIDLVLNLLCRSFDEKISRRERFSARSPLIAHRLVEALQDPSALRPSLLSSNLKIDPRIAGYLLGSDEPSERLSAVIEVTVPSVTFDDLIAPSAVKERLQQVGRLMDAGMEHPVFFLTGADRKGKRQAAGALCQYLGLGLLTVDAQSLTGMEERELADAIELVGREALLQHAAVYWSDIDELFPEAKRVQWVRFLRLVEQWAGPVLVSCPDSVQTGDQGFRKRFVTIELDIPDYDQRVLLWQRALSSSTLRAAGAAESLAAAFRLSAAQIEAATHTASCRAFWRDPSAARIELDDLRFGCRHHSNRAIAELAQKITPRYGWNDIVLPGDRLEQLKEIRDAVQFRQVVYERWGFERKLSIGKGLNILFSGPSGTGKTMAAEIIAKEIGLDLYKIDLSSVVSKYIGETEKNLARVFSEASTSNAILFFDEADALFGKRSEVKDAHDRYANIETGYLLQQMEEYEGVVVLATNLQNNMDDAFLRRMAFSVAFPFPNERDRLRIWEGIWPVETPRASDLDLGFMARQFKLAGGNIKNIGVAAAFLAVADDQLVKTDHLIRATKRELQKLGRVCVKADFGPYYPLVEGAS